MKELGENSSVIRSIYEYGKKLKEQSGEENVFDFSLGNPSVPSPSCVNETLIGLLSDADSVSLHGYTSSAGDIGTRRAIAEYLNLSYGAHETPDMIYMTAGAAESLTVTITAMCCENDEFIVISPYFPEYKVFIEKAGAKIKEVMSDKDMRPDTDALMKAVNKNTKAVIINSPNNPSGVVYTEEEIKNIASVLYGKEKEYGHPIYIISDEPYRELVYGTKAPYIPHFYKDTVSCYSFSKSLSLPGERIGYICVSSGCCDGKALFFAVCGAGRALGYVCAPSLFQKLVPYVIGRTADISVYKTNRDILWERLTKLGFETARPDGAFYMFIKAPGGDDFEFCEKAKKYGILLVPSESFGIKGFARLAYCTDRKTVENSLSAFGKLAEECFNGK